jgi:hypothetical protein
MRSLLFTIIGTMFASTSDAVVNDRSACLCPSCPSYPTCAGEQAGMVFCLSMRPRCVTSERGCKCSKCRVYAKYDLDGNYFCIKGGVTR